MTEKFKARLFLTQDEMEELMDLVDSLEQTDLEDENDIDRVKNWMSIILSLVLGKAGSVPVASGSIEFK